MSNTINTWYDAVLQQMAAEVYLEGVDLANSALVKQRLVAGNNRPGFSSGLTRFSDSQANDFLTRFQIVDQWSDNPQSLTIASGTPGYLSLNGQQILANSGLSATLIKNIDPASAQFGSYTLSVRSTEYPSASNGGDSSRDLWGADAGGILQNGFALAQWSALEQYYAWLKSPEAGPAKLPAGATLSLTGYSLSSNLTTLFTETHPEIVSTVNFNGPGRGTWNQSRGDLSAMLAYYRAALANPNAAGIPTTADGIAANTLYNNARDAIGGLNSRNIYQDPRHIWAAYSTYRYFETTFNPLSDPNRTGLTNGADSRITQLYGQAENGDSQYVSNSGIHGSAERVFIEDQPDVSGLLFDFLPALGSVPNDYGTTHSITLVADSLALMRLFTKIAPSIMPQELRTMFAAASNERGEGLIFTAGTAEGDSLERVLGALGKLFKVTVQDMTPNRATGGFADTTQRNIFYSNLTLISTAIDAAPQPLSIANLVGMSSGELTTRTQATNAFAYRYALKELNPFVVLGADSLYAAHNQNGDLNLYVDAASTPAGMTTEYLVDRVAFLSAKNQAFTMDASSVVVPGQLDNWRYVDLPQKVDLIAFGQAPASIRRRVVFGGDSADVVTGDSQADRLYGGRGTDLMQGSGGDDYMEGGAGLDAYQVNAGDGKDTVLDTDGKGELVRNGKGLALGLKQSEGVWALGGTTYTKDGTDLVVTFADNAADKVTVRNFDFAAGQANGYLGIRLADVPADPAATNQIYGDLEPIDFDPATPGVQTQTDALGNIKTDPDVPAPNRVDTLLDSTGSDFIDAGGGDDLIVATRGGGDWVMGGAGRDRIQTAGGNDIIEGGTGDDIAQGGAGDDRIYGRDKVTLDAAIAAGETAGTVGGTSELLSGDGGNDIVVGSNTSDLLFGGDGKDVIVGGGGNDNIYGDESLITADLTWTATRSTTTGANGGAIYSVALANSDRTSSNTIGAADTIYGGAGDDWVFAGAGDDYVDGGSGQNVLFGEAGNDVLIGGADGDVLVGDSATIDAAGLSGDDYLDGGAGGDTLFGGNGSDILIGGDGIDYLSGGEGNDLLDGGADADQLYGGNGSDSLTGGAGDDQLYGGDGNDVLNGGAGQDVLQGEAGKDTYVFNAGDVAGNEFINDTIDTANSAEASVLVLNGYTRNQIKFRTGSLMVDLGDGGAIHFKGFAPDDPNSTPLLDSIQFADGTSMSYQDVLDQGFDLDGTEGDDVISGTAVTDRIDGKGGNDVITGGSGDDVLIGGTGNDQLFGQAGKDTYVFNRGDGVDVVYDAPQEDDFSDASVLKLGAGIAPEDLKFRLDDARNLLVDTGQGDTVAFANFSASNPASTPVLDSIRFDGGSSMSYTDLLAQGFDLDGTAGDDVIRGTGVTDRVDGMDGNDVLITEGGDDVLHGGAGVDSLNAGEGDDILDGGADDDVLVAGGGNDFLDGGTGDDTLDGGDGNDTLIGGDGFDSLTGGAGDDSIFAGDGDTVIDTEGENHLDLTAYTALTGSNLEITQFQADGGDLYLNLHVRDAAHPGETPDTGGVSFKGGIGSFATVALNDGAGGTVTLTGGELGAFIVGGVVMSGTDGADTVFGTSGDDTIDALDGADTIDAGAGNDRIDGGTGDDTLIGEAGNDTYLLSFNGGHDTVIEDGGAEPDSTNTVQLDAGITADMLAAARLGDDLRIQVKSTGDAMLVKDFYTQPQSWQDAWSVVDGDGGSVGIAALFQTTIPTAEEWLEARAEDFKDRRLQVFASARIAEHLAPNEGKYQRIDRGFSYLAGQATSTTTLSWLTAPETIYLASDDQSINTSYLPVHSTSITASVQLVGQSVLQSTGQGRSAPQKNFGGRTSGQSDSFFVPASRGLSGFSIQQGADITYTPVYGAYIGIPPRDEFGRINANALELKGWQVIIGTASTPTPLAQRLTQNVVQTVALATTNDTNITVFDVVATGSDLPLSIVAMNSVVEAGSGDDSIELTTATNTTISNNIAQYPTLNFFRLPLFRPDAHLNSLIDTNSPSPAQWRFKQLKKSAGEIFDFRYDDMSLPALRTLGSFVDAGAGADQVTGSDGDDTIAGGDGNDVIDGGAGADTYLYSADEVGIDVLTDSAIVDARNYGDWFYWNRGVLNWDERLQFGGMYRRGGNEVNEGAYRVGGYYTDIPGGDYIEPLTDLPPPLTRNDTAVLNALMDAGVLPRDVVKFGPGLSLSDLDLSVAVDFASLEDHPEQPWYTGGTLSVRWGNAGFDTVVPGVDLGNPLDGSGSTLGAGIEEFDFADGTHYTLEEILNVSTVFASGTNEGTPGDDFLEGGAGGELIEGLAGDDVIKGLAGIDSLFGDDGNDTLVGGRDDDFLDGGLGDDTYVFSSSDGFDDIFDEGGSDAIKLNVRPSDVVVQKDSFGALVLGIGAPGNNVYIENWFNADNQIETVSFADGTTWDAAQVESLITTASATPLNDYILGGDANDVLDGLAGDDDVEGGSGNDILSGSDGNDYVGGDAGSNLLLGGDGDDVISADDPSGRNLFIAGTGSDYVYTDAGGSVVAFNAGDGEDTLYSNSGDPVVLSLGGVSAADVVLSTDGSSVRIGVSDTDGVSSYAYAIDPSAWPSGTLQIIGADVRTYDLNAVVQAFLDARAQDPGITQWSAAQALDANLLSVSITEAYGGAVAYQYAMTGSIDGLTPAQQQDVIDGVDFGVAPQSIGQRVLLQIIGTPGDDELDGTSDSEMISGLEGDDSLYGNGGNDTLIGGAGDDYLEGGPGDNTYVYGPGDGFDDIFDEGGTDSVQLGAGIQTSDVVVQKNAFGALVLDVGAPGNYVYVENWFNADNQVENVSFADGTTWDAAQIESRITTASATPLNDFILGGDANDVIDGLAGDDDVEGGGGNDVLSGSDGNDYVGGDAGNNLLLGGAGDDTLSADDPSGRNLFGGGTGNDYVYTQVGGSVVAFNPGDGEDFLGSNPGDPVVLSFGGASAADVVLSTDGFTVRVGDSGAGGISSYAYAGDPANWPSATLQIIGADVRTYDLNAVVLAFKDARAEDPGITQWSAAGALEGDLLTVSTTEAYGGALAYQYATTGGNGGLTTAQQQAVLGDAQFGIAPQPIFAVPINHAPTALALSADTVAENAPNAAIGSLSTTDEDAGDTFTYSILAGDDGAQLAIAGNELRVGSAGLDFEAGATRTVDIRSTDAAGAYFDRAFSINVTDVQEGNTAPVVSASDTTVLIGQSAAASSLFSVVDAESNAITQYEFWDSTSGNGHFTVNGVDQGVNVSIAVPSSSIQDTFFVSGSAIGNDLVWVRANDGQVWSDWKSWTIYSSPHLANAAPEVAAPATQTLLLDQTVAASSLFAVTDADGDAITQYEFWDSTAGNGHFSVNGVEAGVNVSIPVSAADLAATEFVGAASAGSDQVWVRANDGQSWSDWKSWTMNSWLHQGNAAPVAAAADATVILDQAASAASLFSVADGDGDAIAKYEFWDGANGGGYFRVNGVQQGAAQAIAVSAADLAGTEYVGGANPGTEQVWVRANDGMEWGAWKSWNMTTALHIPNAAPVVAASDSTVIVGTSVAASSLFSATDADGDAVTQYEFWDSTAGNGHFAVNGVAQGVNVSIPVSVADIASAQFVAGASTGTDQVWVRVNDGQLWSDWKSWNVTSAPHLTNVAPVIDAVNRTVLLNEAVDAASLFGVTDGDGDTFTQYEFWDSTSGNGHFTVNGAEAEVNVSIPVSSSDLQNTRFVGAASTGTDQVWVRANDGQAWSNWKSWDITSAPHLTNVAPVVTAFDSTLLLNSAVDASSLFSTTDGDGDTIAQYEFWDSTAGGGHFELNGVAQGVNVSIPVSSADLVNTRFVGAAVAGSDQVWVRANDGQVWSDWKSWNVNSWPHLTDAAPVVTASSFGLLRNETVAAGSLFSVSDADGDAAAKYEFWDDVNGGGHFELDGVQQAAGQSIAVAAADLAGATYVGGANAGTEQVWVRANDGMNWSNWKNWLMSTEGGMLRGGAGPDTLNGDADTPILEGGNGDDTLNAGPPNSVLSGGAGNDQLNGGAGDDLLAGGAGNDAISTGAGHNVIAFNAGGGADTIASDAGASNTLSMGGGIKYNDLSLSKDGNDLVLNTGGDDSVRLKDWYDGKDTVANLQLILDATNEFDANSSDPLYNNKVQTFDFRGLVSQFDQALANSPGLTSWAVTNALLQYHLSGADDAALGGDLAYWYGRNNGFTGISLASAQQAIGAAGFGAEAQSLHAFSGLQEGLVKLA